MRQRQDSVDAVLGRDAAQLDRGASDEEQARVREHHPLRLARGAGRIDEGRDVARGIAFDGLGRAALIHRRDADGSPSPERKPCRLHALGVVPGVRRIVAEEEHAAGAAMRADRVDLARRQACVHVHHPCMDR